MSGAFKTISTKRMNTMPGTLQTPVWQRNYYEHIVRNEEDMNSIRDYVLNNLARWEEDENNPIGLTIRMAGPKKTKNLQK